MKGETMAKYTRDEIEAAFERFQAAAVIGGSTGDWTEWSECFTEDARYYEHHYGHYEGRPAILEWITTTMSEPVNRDMVAFPIDWYVIDEARGWIICAVWNQMADPGDGSVHREINWTKLHYAGDGQFDYEEDIYNPSEFAAMIKGWFAAKKRVSGSENPAE
jgi:SnoaL-like domain